MLGAIAVSLAGLSALHKGVEAPAHLWRHRGSRLGPGRRAPVPIGNAGVRPAARAASCGWLQADDRLIVATTAGNDAKLIRAVHDISDDREAQGKFPVQVAGWQDICRHIWSNDLLQQMYAPHSPGGVIYGMRQDQKLMHASGSEAHS